TTVGLPAAKPRRATKGAAIAPAAAIWMARRRLMPLYAGVFMVFLPMLLLKWARLKTVWVSGVFRRTASLSQRAVACQPLPFEMAAARPPQGEESHSALVLRSARKGASRSTPPCATRAASLP